VMAALAAASIVLLAVATLWYGVGPGIDSLMNWIDAAGGLLS
jgi:hypothetical protein